ncbi:MAG: DUF1822 family protein [Desulfobacteraceae bacterium]|nr:DUF1822 family protein [Desulfobacteraceae bacterium]
MTKKDSDKSDDIFEKYIEQEAWSDPFLRLRQTAETHTHPTREMLYDYASGGLDHRETMIMRNHIAFCHACANEVLNIMRIENELMPDESHSNHTGSINDAFTDAPAHLKHFKQTAPGPDDQVSENLKQWFGNLFQGAWKPQPVPSYRGAYDEKTGGTVKRAKVTEVGEQALLLLTPQEGEDVEVSLQVYPSGSTLCLPGLNIHILDKSGAVFMDAEADTDDDGMELAWIRESGDKFSIEISLGDVTLREDL